MTSPAVNSDCGLLRVHLLGTVDFDETLRLQRQLVYQLSGGSDSPALLLCEHPPLITVGRHGSPGELQIDREELAARGWRVRWVARGGGTILHLPGQLAIYPVLPLERLGLDVDRYLALLQQVLVDLLDDFGIGAETSREDAGVRVAGRLIAVIGVALRHQVSTFGAILNVDPDLTLCRFVRSGAGEEAAMTSLARERRGPLRSQLVRQLLVEHFAARFGFERMDVIFPPADKPGHERITSRG